MDRVNINQIHYTLVDVDHHTLHVEAVNTTDVKKCHGRKKSAPEDAFLGERGALGF